MLWAIPSGIFRWSLPTRMNVYSLHLVGVIETLIAQIELCLQEAKRDKSLPASLNTADTARFIFHGFEGVVLHMKVVKSIEPFQAFRSYLTGYLKNTKALKKR